MAHRVRKKKVSGYYVEVSERAYVMIHKLARGSRRPVEDLATSAIAIFVTSVKHVNMMHPPETTRKPTTAKQRAAVPGIGAQVKKIVRRMKLKEGQT